MAIQSIRLVLHSKGARQILRSKAVQQDLNRRGANIAARAGKGARIAPEVGDNRARVAVIGLADKILAALDAGRQ